MQFKFYNQILSTLAGWLNLGSDATEAEVQEAMADLGTREEMQSAIREEVSAEMQGQIDTLQAQVDTLTEQATQLQEQLDAANEQNTAHLAEIEELKQHPAEPHTKGSSNQEEKYKDKLWMKNPINIRAMKSFGQL